MTSPQSKLVIYARTSTDDNQSPEDSLAWQEAVARSLVKGKAEIVGVIHDIDVSRSLPWKRRPEASRLLEEMRDPRRGWDGIVVAEPQRAFGNAMQCNELCAVMAHYRVELWIPDIGGRVDFGSESHDLLLNVFGSISQSERRRLRVRVRAGMETMARSGNRFLGGRPPYGYELVGTGTPHAKPDLARRGVEQQQLAVNAETAPIVERIFEMRAAGYGYRKIASTLNAEGVPSPSAADPDRNAHRRQDGWCTSTVKAILERRSYTGVASWGAVTKQEELLDPSDPSAGHVSRRRTNPDGAIEVPGAIPAIIDDDLWERAQRGARLRTRPGSQSSGATRAKHTYLLSGLLRCAHCGSNMHGERRTYTSGTSVALYVCRYRDNYPSTGTAAEHPTKLTLTEHHVTPLIDQWVADVFAGDKLDDLLAQVVARIPASNRQAEAAASALQAKQAAAQVRLDRLYTLMEDPDYPVERARAGVRQAKSELDALNAEISASDHPRGAKTTVEGLQGLLEHLGGLSNALPLATPAERKRIYRALGLRLELLVDGSQRRLTGTITSDLPSARGMGCVSEGGHTQPKHLPCGGRSRSGDPELSRHAGQLQYPELILRAFD